MYIKSFLFFQTHADRQCFINLARNLIFQRPDIFSQSRFVDRPYLLQQNEWIVPKSLMRFYLAMRRYCSTQQQW